MSLFTRTPIKRLLFFGVVDAVLITASVWLALMIRFDGSIPHQYAIFIPRIIILSLLVIIPIFYLNRLYSFSWSYVSAAEAISLFKATVISSVVLAIVLLLVKYSTGLVDFPRSIIFILSILVFILCGGLRFAKRIYSHSRGFSASGGGKRTLIVGAGDTGEQILRNMVASQSGAYLPVGFVDDNPIKRGIKIHGLKVLGTILDIPSIAQVHRVEQLIIAMPSANSKVIKRAVELGRQAGLWKIKIVPPLAEMIRNEVSLKQLKDVDVEDLLGRNATVLDKKEIESFIKDATVLITGAAGSIGSELSRQVAKFKPNQLVLVDQEETGMFYILGEMREKFPSLLVSHFVTDITDKEKIQAIFNTHKPEVVFHAAAYKHVPLMEAHPDEAVKNNIFGTQTVAEASLASGVKKFIFISTDKAVNPTSVMGATKRFSEMICQAYNQKGATQFISVRFGNVLNSRGSVIPVFKEQIRRGAAVTVTHPDVQRYFMLTSEACLLVMQAAVLGQGGEVFVLDMGKPVKIVDLAREMVRLSGLRPDTDIPIVFTGLRPGEKLFEEMLTAEEGTSATQHQHIFMAKLANIELADIDASLAALRQAVYAKEKTAIIGILKKRVPYYNN